MRGKLGGVSSRFRNSRCQHRSVLENAGKLSFFIHGPVRRINRPFAEGRREPMGNKTAIGPRFRINEGGIMLWRWIDSIKRHLNREIVITIQVRDPA
jgi:hypothetical protein